jgi:hypothetical protein
VVDNNKVTQNGQHLFQATDTPTATNGTPDIPEDIAEDIDIVMARESQAIEETLVREGDFLEVDNPELGLESRESDNLDEEEFSGEDRRNK